jgi:hypothetical protein
LTRRTTDATDEAGAGEEASPLNRVFDGRIDAATDREHNEIDRGER